MIPVTLRDPRGRAADVRAQLRGVPRAGEHVAIGLDLYEVERVVHVARTPESTPEIVLVVGRLPADHAESARDWWLTPRGGAT